MTKKGKRSWKPATRLATFKKSKDYSYQWCVDEPDNLSTLQAEGWEFVNRTTDPNVEIDTLAPHDVSGSMRHRELVLMRLPKDLAEQRRQYYQELTDHQERGVKDKLQTEMSQGGAARAEGSIIID